MIKKIIKFVSCVLIGVICLVVVAVGGLNVAKYAIYSEYYSINENVCKNPGLNDGFACQGIGYNEENEVFLVSGYMKDKSASRIYVTNKDNESFYVSLSRNGKPFKGHCGGLTNTKDNVYLATDDTVFTISLTQILNSNKGDIIEIGEGNQVNNQGSFIYSDENYLYVGEFNNNKQYITDHPYETSEGMHYAIIERYDINDLSKPNKIYSIRDKVQGFCITPEGKIVLSTSYGITNSIFYVYNEADAVDSGLTFLDAPVYYLTNHLKEIQAPAMSEGLDYSEGKIYTMYESACDKYIFGKFFFANYIVSLDI